MCNTVDSCNLTSLLQTIYVQICMCQIAQRRADGTPKEKGLSASGVWCNAGVNVNQLHNLRI